MNFSGGTDGRGRFSSLTDKGSLFVTFSLMWPTTSSLRINTGWRNHCNFRALGKRFGKLTPKVAAAIAAADASRLARELRELGRSLIDLDGESLEVFPIWWRRWMSRGTSVS